jgi:hypothetical protein
MTPANLYVGWIGLLLGGVAGALSGMWFHQADWVGGYTSWPRRMIRLGHIAFFGIGILNVLFALSVSSLELEEAGKALTGASLLLIVGLATMPIVCYLSAWKVGFRHVFFVPAGSVIVGTALFLWRMMNL